MTRPRVGASACLLGSPVRYNGDHKRDAWIADVLSKEVEIQPFCPEMSMGLGAPRPALRLVEDGGTKLRTVNTGQDMTELARKTAKTLLPKAADLDGFILKRSSPSCGLERVKIYHPNGMPLKNGQGVFAEALQKTYPLMPMIEEGRLSDPEQRDNFVLRVFAHSRLRALRPNMRAIQEFHRSYKLILMEHSPPLYRSLGKTVGNAENLSGKDVLEAYSAPFMKALEKLPTVKKRTNVLEHALGYLREVANPTDRKLLAESIQQYRAGEVPFMAPLSVLSHLIRKLKIDYLEGQLFFSPYPRKLGAQDRL